MTGTIPAVVGVDTNESIVFDPVKAAKISIDAAREGAIITVSAHLPDFTQMEISDLGMDYSAKDGQATVGVAARILPNGDKNAVYTAYLDLIADYAKLLNAQDIPILFRPFHEHTGNWFWWGKGKISEQEYIDLWRYTVDYLRNTKDIHNVLYAFSPDTPKNAEEYMYGYPGDDYVDMFGLDFYDSEWHGDTFEIYQENMRNLLDFSQELARKHNKVLALTETGVQNAPDWAKRPDSWFSDIMKLVQPYDVSYFLAWASWNTESFMIPYKTSPTTGFAYVDGFIKFYNNPYSIFANGTEFYGNKLNYDIQVPLTLNQKTD
jgi:mannan endo-1,4-beta-mannosidase